NICSASGNGEAGILYTGFAERRFDTAMPDVSHHCGTREKEHHAQLLAFSEPGEASNNKQRIDRIGRERAQTHDPAVEKPVTNSAPHNLEINRTNRCCENHTNGGSINRELYHLQGCHSAISSPNATL